ncbi:MAG TPA: UDP-2,3-diacylglucosamine diphosphatase, partial [Opitutales bacterium]|nr:UDP-2,3-diacylglucosamine diphosphatase [Opitutales bacterium]
MKKTTLSYKTIFLSDVHLGTLDCKIDEVNHFLKHSHCEKLVLNGDIIDGWSIARRGGWTDQHTRFVRLVLKKVEKRDT